MHRILFASIAAAVLSACASMSSTPANVSNGVFVDGAGMTL